MPTENPKVSGYIPQVVYDHLMQFKSERGLSVSQAVTAILEEYFGCSKVDHTNQRLEKVEGKSLACLSQ